MWLAGVADCTNAGMTTYLFRYWYCSAGSLSLSLSPLSLLLLSTFGTPQPPSLHQFLPNMGADDRHPELPEDLPRPDDPFIQKYLHGRGALIQEEHKQRHG